MPNVTVFIGLGSNLQDPQDQVTHALKEINEIPNTELLVSSSLYITQPLGPANQPYFINAVAKIATSQSAEDLLTELQEIEAKHQRVRGGERWGPRTLDLDILLYADQQIRTNRLIIPHSQMTKREFVLIPLQEIDADLIIPGQGALQEIIEKLPPYQIRKLEQSDGK